MMNQMNYLLAVNYIKAPMNVIYVYTLYLKIYYYLARLFFILIDAYLYLVNSN